MSRRFKRVSAVILIALAGAFVYQRIAAMGSTPGAAAKSVEISGTDLDGKTWSLADHRGKGPVVINFFGTR